MKKTAIITAVLTAALSLPSCLDSGDDTVVFEEAQPASQQGGGSGNNGGYSNNPDRGRVPSTNTGANSGSGTTGVNSGSGTSQRTGSMPSGSSSAERMSVSNNSRVLSGGGNAFTVTSSTKYDEFYYSDSNGNYTVIDADDVEYEVVNGVYYYYILVDYGESSSGRSDVTIGGTDKNGTTYKPVTKTITYEETSVGTLNVYLTFSRAIDLDLHLYTPEGEHLSFMHRGGSYTTSGGKKVYYGLDHDSNAGCILDSLNSENIYLPAELITPGEYRVAVSLFDNCLNALTKYWVSAYFKGEKVSNLISSNGNPYAGTIAKNKDSMAETTVMRFKITQSQVSGLSKVLVIKESFEPVISGRLDEIKAQKLYNQ